MTIFKTVKQAHANAPQKSGKQTMRLYGFRWPDGRHGFCWAPSLGHFKQALCDAFEVEIELVEPKRGPGLMTRLRAIVAQSRGQKGAQLAELMQQIGEALDAKDTKPKRKPKKNEPLPGQKDLSFTGSNDDEVEVREESQQKGTDTHSVQEEQEVEDADEEWEDWEEEEDDEEDEGGEE